MNYEIQKFAFSCPFRDNCYQATAGGSDGDAHLNFCNHSFSDSISNSILNSDKVCLLLPHQKHCGDLP